LQFTIAGTTLKILQEGETHKFLGNPVGFRAIAPQDDIEEIVRKSRSIFASALAPWQKLDAVKTFIYPADVGANSETP
ncbi:hypothetical protein, partial [Klebsiella pneumoniae]|uniref:hypothetical protein n=1 Tax=Klebsiella pneumoniae TaxID=573 RepID=UPI0040558776